MSNLTQDQLVEALSTLTVLELSELKVKLEDKWGVKAAAAAPAFFAGAAAGPAAAVEESTEFLVTLTESAADKKISVIKVVREITGLGLKEAKDLVEGAPKPLKESASKAEAEEILKKIEAAGGKATMKGL